MAKSKAMKWLTKAGLQKIENWAREGMTDAEIAQKMGIGKSTLRDYKVKYPPISLSIENGKKDSLELAERMVFEHIRGFEYEEYEKAIIKDNHGNEQEKLVTKTKKAPPSERMLQFYLRNRFPDVWNGKGSIEMERLQLENERLKAELEERKQSDTQNNYEKDRQAFESKIDDVLDDYVSRLEGWFDES